MRYLVAIGLGLFWFQALPAKAQIFGYETYSECLVEEMKDRPQEHTAIVRDYCSNIMKHARELNEYERDDIELSWHSQSADTGYEIVIRVEENTSSRHLTKVVALATIQRCEDVEDWSTAVEVEFVFPEVSQGWFKDTKPSDTATSFFPPTEPTPVKPSCMRYVKYWGYHK